MSPLAPGVAMAANVLSFGGLAPFVVTRQVVGGAALEEMDLDERPAVFTVAGHAVEPPPGPTSGARRRRRASPRADRGGPGGPGRLAPTSPSPDFSGGLKSARVVVGAGRGAGSPDGFGGPARAHLAARWLAGRLTGGHQRWAGGRTTSRSARPAAGSPRALHPVRHQRRDPALGGLLLCQEHPGHQHRPGGTDGDESDVRSHRGDARGGPRGQRGDPPAPGVSPAPGCAGTDRWIGCGDRELA